MERAPATSNEPPAKANRGEIVVLNGKHRGVRRALKSPLTFIGSADGCDIRLNAPGVAAMHALIVFGGESTLFRQLDAKCECRVNDKRIVHSELNDGDTLSVGPFLFRLHLQKPVHESAHTRADWDALRVQAAAVAAQHAALGDEEARLDERQSSLLQQEEQLAAHLEEKRRQLTQLHDKTAAERKALDQDRIAYEKYVANVAGNLTDGQRELMDGQRHLQVERDRLLRQQKQLQKHWKRRAAKNEQQLALRVEEIANDAASLNHESKQIHNEREKLVYHRSTFFGQYELGRRQLHAAWEQLHEAQRHWRQRRSQERSLLKLKESDLANLERELADTRANLRTESERWAKQRQFMQQEISGLNDRIENRRRQLSEIQQPHKAPSTVDPAKPGDGNPSDHAVDTDKPSDSAVSSKLVDLDAMAGELADQRLQLAEHWERLATAKKKWEAERTAALDELEKTANDLRDKETLMDERAQGQQQIENNLRGRHEELNRLRQNLIGWRARLHAQQSAFDSERSRVLEEARNRDETAKKNLGELNDFRKQWGQRAKHELEQLKTARAEYDKEREACRRLQQKWNAQLAELQNEKRELAEKTLALEQYRQETILKGHNSPAIERRLERLRRRWMSQNAESIRSISDARQELSSEIATLNQKTKRLQMEMETLEKRNIEWVDREMRWEQQELSARAKHAKMEAEVRVWKQKHEIVEQQLRETRHEVERLAQSVMDEPDLPETKSKAA